MMHPRQQAIAFYNQAVGIAKTDAQMAYRLFNSAVEIDPSFAEGWYAIGNANSDMGLREASVANHRRAVECDPSHDKAWTNLGHQLYHIGRHEEALAATQQAIKINASAPNPWCNLSLIQSVLGETHASLRAAKHAYSLAPGEPAIEVQLAFAYFFVGDWANGFKHFEARFPYKLPAYLNFPYPQWHGEGLDGKSLFIVAEQGIGDTLSFLRFLPDVAARGGEVLLQVQPELLSLTMAMLAGATGLKISPLGSYPMADYWCAMTSLPVALGLTTQEIAAMPGVPVPSTGLGDPPSWKAHGRKLHVGIAWAGSPQNDIDRWRSFDVKLFLELYKVPGIQLYSLQVGPSAMDLHAAGCAALIRDMSPYIRDVADTVAIVRDLDLVITAETSMGHISGSIDADCWVLVAKNGGDWRVGRKGDTSLWYRRHRVFRQNDDAAWPPVFRKVAKALKERIGS